MCIEREKDNFKSREVNCLKECALALMILFSVKYTGIGILEYNDTNILEQILLYIK